VDLGALDVDPAADGTIAALLPDTVSPARAALALGRDDFRVSTPPGRDEGSVWILRPRRFGIGRLSFAPEGDDPSPGTIRLIDTPAFGTGLHPTTALCVEALQETVDSDPPQAVLDVGTGSGVLALAAVALGTPRVLAIDTAEAAVRVAAQNARLNGVGDRLQVRRGGPGTVSGTWPLVLANILAAPLIEMAPVLVRRVGRRGLLVLSGIPVSVEPDVSRTYQHLGMRRIDVKTRGGWTAVVLRASW
jgi:ribosomal protein L11 methyltransferase